VVALFASAWLLACEGIQNRVIERGAASAQAVDGAARFDEDGLHVVLCGTGSPLPDANRAGPCTAVLAGGMMFVVDSGPGSTENLTIDRMPWAQLRGVLLTHFHSDHIGELGELNMQSWAGGGRTESLRVYGPPGVQRVVDGFSAAYALDTEYRVAHHGADVVAPEGGEMLAVTFDPPADGSAVTVLEQGDLRISAVSVDHRPIVPAVGYRFDYKGRSVVISGDTVASENLVRLATSADMLIHEVLVMEVLKTLSGVAADAGNRRISKIAMDVTDYHTSPGQAVDVAKQAGVDTIVFSHMVPPLPGIISDSIFMRGVDDEGKVNVVLGEDHMHFTLPAGGSEIRQDSL
jgi:ribonuclease Z